jgi:putative ABC transport system ATP-binding protein
MDAMVEIKNVRKSYYRGKQQIEVLKGINLSVGAGEFLALMGPSGSGKTTLLNLIGGLDVPTAGSVIVDGRDVAKLDEVQLARWRSNTVGFIFQSYNLLPMLSAQRNVELPLMLTKLGWRKCSENAALALALVGLTDRARHKPGELSGGQQQRVAIARAIVSDPKLLICDEPTGDLDRQSAHEVLDLLRQLRTEHGKTIVMVTHDPKAAESASRIVHLDKGEITEESREHGRTLTAVAG